MNLIDKLDFTLAKYKKLCLALIENYKPVTVYDYLTGTLNNGFVIMRHDVDRKPNNALKMAELEHELGIRATYYFRYPYTFKQEIIRKINRMGHETGYHYEVLSKAKGDYEKAIDLFEQELKEFRKIIDVKTICMHGSPLSKHDNRDLWKRYDFKEFGIIGEAYLSISGVSYFSDTGRSWNWKNKMRDFMADNNNDNLAIVNTTDELIRLIRSKKVDKFYILAHPERWALNSVEWGFNCTKDFAFNVGKKILRGARE
ncbi:hypothetical protein DRP05_13355 [Archaeoglobales archaeon]|nr:MAG: hypothetical protein DRP05_13355 [Archaeoglobales archaeon]